MKTVMALLLTLAVSMNFSQAQTNQKKITVYTDEFAGQNRELGRGEYDNLFLIRSGIITIRSVKVPKGMKVTLYSQDQFQGQALELTEDANTSFLESKGYAQTILSVSLVVEELVDPSAVSGPSITIYRDDFSGTSRILGPGRYEFNELGDVGNDQLSSIKIPAGLKVTLYEHGGFKGRTLVLTNDTRAAVLVRSKFNDLTSSMLVEVVPVAQAVPAIVLPATTVVVVPPVETQPVTVAAPVVINEPAEPIIYAGDFSGTSKSIRAGRYSSEQLGIGNDQLSSIKVPRGYKVTLYDDDAFEGRTLVLTNDARAAFLADSNFNNLTSSILVEALPMVTIYEGEYNGASINLAPGRYGIKDLGISNDQLSSVRVPAGMRVTLFENDGFWGRSVVLTQNSGADALSRSAFNDLTSSLIVEVVAVAEKATRTVTLYSDDFSGPSIKLAAGRYTSAQLGISDNTLSSLQIPRGLEVTVFENDNFNGRAMIVRGDTRLDFFNSSAFNDIASSIEIKEVFNSDASVTVFTDRFGGKSQALMPGRYMLRDLSGGDNQISSARVPQGMRVVMYEDDNFQGYSVTAEADIDLSQAFNDRVSSLTVEDVFTPVVSPRTARPTGLSGSRRPTSSPSNTPAQPQAAPIVPAAAAATADAQPPPCAMNPSQFENALNAIRFRNRDAEKMDLARISTKERCLSLPQIRAIGGVFMSEDLTLEFVKYAYDASSEKAEYYLLQDMFKFMSTRDAFTQFLKSK